MSGVVIEVDSRTIKARRELSNINRQLAEIVRTASTSQRGIANIDKQSFNNLSNNVNNTGVAFSKLSKNATNTMSSVKDATETATSSLTRMAQVAGTVFAAAYTFKGFTELSDEMTNLETRIKMVTNSQAQFNYAFNEVGKISIDNRVGLTETAKLFTKTAMSAKELGVTLPEIRKFTDLSTKAVASSGANAQEASAGLLQLGQALGAGTLAGDELKSIMENIPGLAREIAAGLNISYGEMKKLGEEGKLTSKEVFDAILKRQEQINTNFKLVGVTYGQAFTNLATSLKLLFRAVSKSIFNSTTSLADGINNIAIKISNIALNFSKAILDARGIIVVFVDDTLIMFDEVSKWFVGFADDVKKSATTLYDEWSPTLYKMFEDIRVWSGGVIVVVGAMANSLITAFKNSAFGSAIIEYFTGVFAEIPKLFNKAISYIQFKFPNLNISKLMPDFEYVLSYIKSWAIKVERWFFWIYDKVIGHSWIPDLVEGVKTWMAKLMKTPLSSVKTFASKVSDIFKKLRGVTIVGAGFGLSTLSKYSKYTAMILAAVAAIGGIVWFNKTDKAGDKLKSFLPDFESFFDRLGKIITGTYEKAFSKVSSIYDRLKETVNKTSFAHMFKQFMGIRDTTPGQLHGRQIDTKAFVGLGPERNSKDRTLLHDSINTLPVGWQIPTITALTGVVGAAIIGATSSGTFRTVLLSVLTSIWAIVIARTVDSSEIRSTMYRLGNFFTDTIAKGMDVILGGNAIKDPLGLLSLIAKSMLLFAAGRAFLMRAAVGVVTAPTALVNSGTNRYARNSLDRDIARTNTRLATLPRDLNRTFNNTNTAAFNSMRALSNLRDSTGALIGQTRATQALLTGNIRQFGTTASTMALMRARMASTALNNARTNLANMPARVTELNDLRTRQNEQRTALSGLINEQMRNAGNAVRNTAAGTAGIVGGVAGYQLGAEIARGMTGAPEWAKVGVTLGTSFLGQGIGAALGFGVASALIGSLGLIGAAIASTPGLIAIGIASAMGVAYLAFSDLGNVWVDALNKGIRHLFAKPEQIQDADYKNSSIQASAQHLKDLQIAKNELQKKRDTSPEFTGAAFEAKRKSIEIQEDALKEQIRKLGISLEELSSKSSFVARTLGDIDFTEIAKSAYDGVKREDQINEFFGGLKFKFDTFMNRMRVPGYATGGRINGPGTGTSDSIPAMLSNGEFVVNAKATSNNRELLQRINGGETVSHFAKGTAAPIGETQFFMNSKMATAKKNGLQAYAPETFRGNIYALAAAIRIAERGGIKLTDIDKKLLLQNSLVENRPDYGVNGIIGQNGRKFEVIVQQSITNPDLSIDDINKLIAVQIAADTKDIRTVRSMLSNLKGKESLKILDSGVRNDINEEKLSSLFKTIKGRQPKKDEIYSEGNGYKDFMFPKYLPFAELEGLNVRSTDNKFFKDELIQAQDALVTMLYMKDTQKFKTLEDFILSGRWNGKGRVLSPNGVVADSLNHVKKLKALDIPENLGIFDTYRKELLRRDIPTFENPTKMTAESGKEHINKADSEILMLFTSLLDRFKAAIGLATGGRISGPGTGTSDSIPAMLSNGEFVINAKASRDNAALLHAINSGTKVSMFSQGNTSGPELLLPNRMASNIPVKVEVSNFESFADNVGNAFRNPVETFNKYTKEFKDKYFKPNLPQKPLKFSNGGYEGDSIDSYKSNEELLNALKSAGANNVTKANIENANPAALGKVADILASIRRFEDRAAKAATANRPFGVRINKEQANLYRGILEDQLQTADFGVAKATVTGAKKDTSKVITAGIDDAYKLISKIFPSLNLTLEDYMKATDEVQMAQYRAAFALDKRTNDMNAVVIGTEKGGPSGKKPKINFQKTAKEIAEATLESLQEMRLLIKPFRSKFENARIDFEKAGITVSKETYDQLDATQRSILKSYTDNIINNLEALKNPNSDKKALTVDILKFRENAQARLKDVSDKSDFPSFDLQMSRYGVQGIDRGDFNKMRPEDITQVDELGKIIYKESQLTKSGATPEIRMAAQKVLEKTTDDLNKYLEKFSKGYKSETEIAGENLSQSISDNLSENVKNIFSGIKEDDTKSYFVNFRNSFLKNFTKSITDTAVNGFMASFAGSEGTLMRGLKNIGEGIFGNAFAYGPKKQPKKLVRTPDIPEISTGIPKDDMKLSLNDFEQDVPISYKTFGIDAMLGSEKDALLQVKPVMTMVEEIPDQFGEMLKDMRVNIDDISGINMQESDLQNIRSNKVTSDFGAFKPIDPDILGVSLTQANKELGKTLNETSVKMKTDTVSSATSGFKIIENQLKKIHETLLKGTSKETSSSGVPKEAGILDTFDKYGLSKDSEISKTLATQDSAFETTTFSDTMNKYGMMGLGEQTSTLNAQDASFDGIADAVAPMTEGFFGALKGAFSTGLGALGNLLKGDIGGFLGGIGDLFKQGLSALQGLFSGGSGGGGGLGGMLSGLWGGIKEIGGSIWSGLTTLFMAEGGQVYGGGTETSDSIPAMLSKNEFVVNAKATRKHLSLLNAINTGNIGKFAAGGLVGASMLATPSIAGFKDVRPVNNSNSQQIVNVNVTGDISRQTKSEIYKMLPSIAAGVNNHNREKGNRT